MSSRHIGAVLLGLVAGGAGCGLVLAAGLLLYRRLWADDLVALLLVAVGFGAAGLYAGWMLGLVVFSAIRGPGESEETAA